MIFFLVSASVPIDMRAPSGHEGSVVARRAGACSPGHSRSAAVARQPDEIISGRGAPPKRRRRGRTEPAYRHTDGGGSLRCRCSVVVWLPSEWVVVETVREP